MDFCVSFLRSKLNERRVREMTEKRIIGSAGRMTPNSKNVDYLQERIDFLKEVIKKKEEKIKHYDDVNDLRDLERLEQMVMSLMKTLSVLKQD